MTGEGKKMLLLICLFFRLLLVWTGSDYHTETLHLPNNMFQQLWSMFVAQELFLIWY